MNYSKTAQCHEDGSITVAEGAWGATGGSVYSDGYGESRIYDVKVHADRFEVYKRADAQWFLASNPPKQPPAKVWKEVWLIVAGKPIRQADVVGFHVPAMNIPESITFP